MRSFLAMLKDSFREAVDGWIFVVMLGLAGVITLVVASASVTPLPADVAVPAMVSGGGGGPPDAPTFQVRPDRGRGAKAAVFYLRLEVSDAVSGTAGATPWAGPLDFTATFKRTQPGRLAPAGVVLQLGEDRQPDLTSLKDLFIFGDSFKEAVRYWAMPVGGEKPAYTDDLAREFAVAQLADQGRLAGGTATKKPGVGGLFGSSDPAFAVTGAAADRVAWAHHPSLLFGAVSLDFPGLRQPLGQLIYTLESILLNGLGAWVLLLAGVVVTAGFIPNMLRKGAIDLLLTKPVSRPLILFYKYLGGLLFVLLITAVTVGGVWVAVGLRTGIWAVGILWSIGGITFYFAILYACSTLVGVLTRNAIVSIVLTIVFWFLVWLVGVVFGVLNAWDSITALQSVAQTARQAQVQADKGGKGDKKAEPKKEEPAAEAAPVPDPESKIPRWLLTSFKWANKLTPRTSDLDTLTSGLIARGLLSPADGVRRESREIKWVEVVGVAGGWIVLLMGLATLRFVTRSY